MGGRLSASLVAMCMRYFRGSARSVKRREFLARGTKSSLIENNVRNACRDAEQDAQRVSFLRRVKAPTAANGHCFSAYSWLTHQQRPVCERQWRYRRIKKQFYTPPVSARDPIECSYNAPDCTRVGHSSLAAQRSSFAWDRSTGPAGFRFVCFRTRQFKSVAFGRPVHRPRQQNQTQHW